MLVLSLVTVWALRLSAYITIRNWGQAEDYRYRAIRARNEPGFAFKSLYLVFGLQGLLAWFIAMPIVPAITSSAALSGIDALAAALWLIGFVFEAGGDYQLRKFQADKSNKGRVLDTGLWRYTRHPNYFGDCVVWWGLFAMACAVPGGAFTVLSPIVMTLLLRRVSGVTLLERSLRKRKPDYEAYVARTNAFVPWPPRA